MRVLNNGRTGEVDGTVILSLKEVAIIAYYLDNYSYKSPLDPVEQNLADDLNALFELMRKAEQRKNSLE